MLPSRLGIRLTIVTALAVVTFALGPRLASARQSPDNRAPADNRAAGVTSVNATPNNVAPASGTDDAAIMASICPIVFPLEAFPTEQGQRYLFYGNAFFINDEGYLVTAAHVISSFGEGGQPNILVGAPGGTHRLLQANVVAVDWAHDVAILRATPNPFTKNWGVKFLPLTLERSASGKGLLLVSLHPSDPQYAYSLQLPIEDHVTGKVLKYQFSDGETEGTGRELIAMSQNVVPGQSGSPVISSDTHEVIGIALGRWMYPGLLSLAASVGSRGTSPGAVLPVHYAIALLHDHGIAWQSFSVKVQSVETVSTSDAGGESAARTVAQTAGQVGGQATAPAARNEICPPVPISLVSTPYPPQALFGGEVAVDALVDASGKLDNVSVAHGEAPFLDLALDAARTWSFDPAELNGRPLDARVGIFFQFPQSFLPPLAPTTHTYDDPSASSDHAALPTYTTEPNYPANTVVEGSVAVYATIDREGKVVSTHVLRELEPLSESAVSAIHQWHFSPARQGGVNVESAVVVVFTFRRPAVH